MGTRHVPAAALAAAAGLLALVAPFAAHADAAPPEPAGVVLSPMVGFAFTTGGERLVHVIIVNQDTGAYMGSTAVKAGGQDYAYLGGELRFPRARLAVQATVGYHWDSKGGNNVDVTFSRVPFELVGLYQPLDWLRIGGGVRYDTRVHMTGKGDASDPMIQQTFANAFGPVLKAEFMVQPDAGIELRWTDMKYKLRSVGGVDVSDMDVKASGRAFGVGVDLHF